MTLLEARKQAGFTQAESAARLGVSLRSYKSYETDPRKAQSIKYRYMTEQLAAVSFVDETHGLLSQEQITQACNGVLSLYPVSYCYLFGSYAKGTANEQSDVDLLVSGNVEGLRFYGMVEALKTALKKNADVLTPAQLRDNPELLDEILRYGVKIYG